VVTEALARGFASGLGLQTGFTDALQVRVADTLCTRTGAERVRFFLGGANMPLGLALGTEITTPSAIIDNRNPPGTFSFITTNYTVSEGAGSVSIMVIRTGGSGDTVTLKYLTQDLPGTPPPGIGFARSNINYFATSGTLTFYPGITNQSFNVGIRDDGHVDPDLALLLVITNIVAQHPMNGTALGGVTNAWLTIIDSDFPQGRLNFSAASFVTNETAGNAIIKVTRTGGSQGAMTVLCSTTNTVAGPGNTPAVPGVNYYPVTNVLLAWTNGDSAPKFFMVPVLHDNQITPNLTVGLRLSTPVLNGVTNGLALGLTALLLVGAKDEAPPPQKPVLKIDLSPINDGKSGQVVSYADVVEPVQKAVVSIYSSKTVRRHLPPSFRQFFGDEHLQFLGPRRRQRVVPAVRLVFRRDAFRRFARMQTDFDEPIGSAAGQERLQ